MRLPQDSRMPSVIWWEGFSRVQLAELRRKTADTHVLAVHCDPLAGLADPPALQDELAAAGGLYEARILPLAMEAATFLKAQRSGPGHVVVDLPVESWFTAEAARQAAHRLHTHLPASNLLPALPDHPSTEPAIQGLLEGGLPFAVLAVADPQRLAWLIDRWQATAVPPDPFFLVLSEDWPEEPAARVAVSARNGGAVRLVLPESLWRRWPADERREIIPSWGLASGERSATAEPRDTPRSFHALRGRNEAALAACLADAATAPLAHSPLRAAIERRLDDFTREAVIQRLWQGDWRLWSPVPRPELTDRLGWLSLPDEAEAAWEAADRLRRELLAEGYRHALLLGMGGSSLAPELFARLFPKTPDGLQLHVLDSTHPKAVARITAELDWQRTLVLVSSKSGTTTETLALFAHAWQVLERLETAPGRHFIAITDPATPLVELGKEHSFRQVILGPPTVGGRYSALSVFGLVPLALTGSDGRRLIASARAMATAARQPEGRQNPVATLAAWLAEALAMGRDKCTFLFPDPLLAFADWLEQLMAESTGKDGRGMLPVAGEPWGHPERYGRDRAFVHIRLTEDKEGQLPEALAARGHPVFAYRLTSPYDLGQEFFRWEGAIALLGHVLGIHPFNQPDVQAAKDATKAVLQEGRQTALDQLLQGHEAVEELLSLAASLPEGHYLALQAYLAPDAENHAALRRLQAALRDASGRAVTAGFGPRYLHSTGQYHKGGPANGAFVQLLDRAEPDLPIPGASYSFRQLIHAQAEGDFRTLTARGRPVIRLWVEDLPSFVAAVQDTLTRRGNRP